MAKKTTRAKVLMKLFIYEHITSGALIDKPLPPSLAREGNKMLTAIVQDLIQLSNNIELIILRDARLESLNTLLDIDDTHHIYSIDSLTSFHKIYLNTINNVDMVFVIAPETGGVLDKIQQEIHNSNAQLLSSHRKATQISSDKYQCFQQLSAHSIASPTTVKANEWSQNNFTSTSGFIIKPQDGAGCIDTFFMADNLALESWLQSHLNNLNNVIIQPYIDGQTISLSILLDDTDSRVLAINQQNIRINDGKLSFLGSIVNGVDENVLTFAQAAKITSSVQQAITGLWGFIGIDLILHKDELFVIDINPRLTTSYIGLRQSLNHNPAQLLFTMMEQGLSELPTPLQQHAIEVNV